MTAGGGTCRLSGLIFKEIRQIVRDRHLLFLLIFPPTIQLLLLGAALDPGVHHVALALADNSKTALSRRLIKHIAADSIFHVEAQEPDAQAVARQVRSGAAAIGVVVPASLQNDVDDAPHRGVVQAVVDGSDAYTAGIACAHLQERVRSFQVDADDGPPPVSCLVTNVFNPDLKSSWYFVPGVMGAMLTLTSTLVASAALLREKELGTLEQLLITPYATWEILLSKVVPLFVLLAGDALLAVLMAMAVFGLPFRGNPAAFALAAALYIAVGISLGMVLATVCRTERQSHLLSFFVNVPVMQLAGAVIPFETMPAALRAAGALDPLRYFTVVARSLLVKGTAVGQLWMNLLALFCFAVVLFGVSCVRFRRQLD